MLVVVSLLVSLRLVVRSRAALHLEILALRHQLAVVKRSRRPRVRLTTADRLLWAWLSQRWCGWALGAACRPTGDCARVASARLPPVRDVEESTPHRSSVRPARLHPLIRQISTANPLWGAPRIDGELQKLGISVSQSTVAKYMRRDRPRPSQTWRTFLANHAHQVLAADFFVVPTATFRLLFVLVILAHDRRRIVHVAVTHQPTAVWTAQQLRNGFPENQALGYLLHDRDTAFTDVATTVSPRWTCKQSARHRVRPGRMRTWSASSVRST